jgi:hypothetical protein
MKNQNLLTRFTLLFAVLLTLGAAQAQADIFPGATIGFAPVGITMDQTARLKLISLTPACRAKAFGEVWKCSTMTPARPPCAWAEAYE